MECSNSMSSIRLYAPLCLYFLWMFYSGTKVVVQQDVQITVCKQMHTYWRCAQKSKNTSSTMLEMEIKSYRFGIKELLDLNPNLSSKY